MAMEKLCWSFAVLFIFCTAVRSQAVPSVKIEAETSELSPGGEFSISCRVSNLRTPNFFRLEKYGVGDDMPVDLMTNSFIVSPFDEIERYQGGYGSEEDIFIFTFTVSDARVEDSGEYSCTVFGNNIRIAASERHPVNILVEPQTFELVVTDPETGEEIYIEEDMEPFEFDEEVRRDIRCSVTGSNPAPMMRMMVGSADVSDRFTYDEQSNPSPSADNRRLKKPSFDAEMSAEGILIDNSFVRNGFQCEASVGSKTYSKSFAVKLQGFAPEFINCSSTLDSYNGHGDVRYACRVFASPPPSVYFYFERLLESNDTEKVEIYPGEVYTHYTFFEYEEGEEIEVVLYMDRMFPQMFRTHYLVASNEVGENVLEIEFIRDYDMEPTDSASQMTVSVTLVLLVAVAQYLLHW